MSVIFTSPIEVDQQSTCSHSSSSSEKNDDVKSSPSTIKSGIALAKAKTDRDVAEQKRTEAISLRKSRGDLPEFLEIMGSEIVDIHVGPQKKLFRVHRGILCDKVPYFRKMFSSGFVEGLEGKAFFPEDDPKCFDFFMGWIYFGTLRVLNASTSLEKIEHDLNLLSLYSFADKLCLPELMDLVLDTYKNTYEKSNRFPRVSLVSDVYQMTPKDSPLRKLMCHCMYYIFVEYNSEDIRNFWTTEDMATAMSLHQDLTIDFLNLMRSDAPGFAPQDPRAFPNCDFHCHGEDEPCSQRSN
ncbi:uncharacterized protein EAE98_004357 [Botrytis deweyae]|uniref:BTB domain-containing protein n=1 Tax=Botrytis deweyae TaxID=2478750 RepID=A0ABQ7IQN0_9HELO|nr:uncharacterized protein EAE98_004357 [Botrytis deweyae]KAF7931621.1 hypothetical protein EAE98_004357 [Botrytis deweyae]